MAIATAIKGRKGGSSSSRTATEQPDDLQSVAKAKILLALGEGEFAGGLTARDIYLDGTALENADGSQNFSGVAWEFRSGTQAQKYIQGIPGTENEINVGSEVSSSTAWTRTFTNTQLSAVRLRLKWPSHVGGVGKKQFCGFRDLAKNIHRRKWAWPRPKDAADSSEYVGTSF